jgi:ABC-2 type transport system permease protein
MLALIRFETVKIFSQSKCALGVFAVVMINVMFVMGFILKRREPGHLKRMLGDNILDELFNSLVYTQTILSPCASILFPVLTAVIVSYIFAGEHEIGTLRLTMARPVSRLQIILAKWVASAFYTAALLVSLLLIGLLLSSLIFQFKGDLVIIGEAFGIRDKFVVHPYGPGAWARIAVSYLMTWPMLLSISCLSFMFASLTRNFALSAILASTTYLSCFIAGNLPFLSAIHPFLPTRYMPFWRHALRTDIPWAASILPDALWTLAFSVSFLLVAWLAFEKKDF